MRGLLVGAVGLWVGAASCADGAKAKKTGRAPEMDQACADSDRTDQPQARWTKPEDGDVAGSCDEIWVDWGEKKPDGTLVEGQRTLWCCKAMD